MKQNRRQNIFFYCHAWLPSATACQYFFANPRDHQDGLHVTPCAKRNVIKEKLQHTYQWYCNYHIRFDDAILDSLAIDKRHRIMVVKETNLYQKAFPESHKELFGIVISPYEPIGYQGRWIRQSCLIWRYGTEACERANGLKSDDYDANPQIWDRIFASKYQHKTRKLSVFFSNKPGRSELRRAVHMQRHLFVEALQEAMGDDVHVYGHGYEEDDERKGRFIADKADGLDPYRYTIALENNTIPHFWTEKIADAYLGEAYPFYYGCANIGDDFPHQAFTPIDINDIEGSVRTIKEICDSDLWKERYPFVLEAKRLVIEKYHLKAILRRIVEGDESLYEKT